MAEVANPTPDPTGLALSYNNGSLTVTWRTDWYPPTFRVVLTISDQAGNPLDPPPTISMGNGQATVTGPAIKAGQALNVTIHAESPAPPAQGLDPVDLPQVAQPTLLNAGGIQVDWNAPAIAIDHKYGVRVLDQAGGELAPQPPVTFDLQQPTRALIDATALTDHTPYQVQVRAVAGLSVGDWSPPATVTLDKSAPASELLRALRDRLAAAGAAFTLNADLVQSDPITALFGSLLGFAADAIPLTGATLSTTAATVTLSATATLFTRSAAATFVFSAADDTLQLQLSATLGDFTVQQLYAARILPPASDDPASWAGNLALVSGLTMTLASQEQKVGFTAQQTASAWDVLNIAGVHFTPVTPLFEIYAPEPGEFPRYLPRVTTELVFNSTSQLPIYLELPTGLAGWRVGLNVSGPNAANGYNLNDLSLLSTLLNATATGLPGGVVDLQHFWLTRLDVAFAAGVPDQWQLDLGLYIGQTGDGANPPRPVWKIIEGVLEIQEIAASLAYLSYKSGDGAFHNAVSGALAGTLLVAGHPLEVAVDVPVGPDGWRLASGAPLELANGLADLKQFLKNNATVLADALAALGTVQSVAINTLEMTFDPTPGQATIHRASFGLVVSQWQPSLPWLTVNEVGLLFDVRNPLDDAQRKISGNLWGSLQLGPIEVDAWFSFAQGQGFTLEVVAALDQLALTDLPSQLISPTAITTQLPGDLPTSGALSLDRLFFAYEAQGGYFSEIYIKMSALPAWTVANGLFSLWALYFELDFVKSAADGQTTVTGMIGADIELAGAPIRLLAEKLQTADPWVLKGWLQDTVTLDFSQLAGEVVAGDLTLPQVHAFPPAITLVRAEAQLTPATGKFDFTGLAFLNWPFGFANAQFRVTELGGEVHIPGSDEADQSKRALIVGNFEFGELVGRASLQLGTQSTPVVLDVVLGDAATLDVAKMVNALCSTDQSDVYDQVPAPAEFTKPHFFQAGLHVDLTNDVYALYGQYVAAGTDGLYAAVALLVKKETIAGGTTQWGFVFAAMLQNWRFAQIASELSVVDTVLSVKKSNAAVALSLLDAQTDETITTYIPAINAQLSVRRGLNFYAELEFTSGLLSTLATILGVSGQGPFTISGYIPADAGQSEFTASLKNLTLLGFLEFNTITLIYKTAASGELTLTGQIVVHVGSARPAFQGNLLVDAQQASFSVETTQQIDNPLGLPRITIEALKFSFTNIFATSTEPAQLTMTLEGTVTAFTGLTLTGFVLFKDGATVVAGARIVQRLSIDALFQKYLSSAWPTGLLAIAFKDGSLYYAPNAVTVGETAYMAGFHLSAHVDIYFLHDILIAVDIQDGNQIQASATWPTVIDWRFIKFYGATDHTLGPAVALNSTARTFTLTCGVELFDAPILDQASITIGAQAMSGSLRFAQALGPLAGATLDFTLDDQGFHVTNLPVDADKLPKLIFELADFLQDASNVECPVDFITKLAVESRLHLSPSMSISFESVPGNNGAAPTSAPFLNLTVNGTLGLVTNSAIYDGDIITANLVEATLKVPFPGTGAFTWDMLGDKLIECVKSAAQSIFHNLVQDPQNLAKLLAVVGIEFAVSKLVDYFVCKGLSAEAAEAAAAAATGAATAEIVVDGVAVTVGGVVGVIVGGVFTNHSGGSDPAKPKPDTPAAPTVLRYAGDHLHVEWSTVNNANLYTVLYAADGGASHSTNATAGTALDLPLPAGPRYRVQIVAAGDGGVSAPGPAAEIQTFAAPGGLMVSFQDPALTVQWQDVAGGQAEYHVDVLHNGQSLGAALTVTASTPTSRQFQSTQFENGGDFTVTVYGQTATVTSPTASQPLQIVLLPAPAAPTLQTVGSTIEARWTPTAGATYAVRVLDGNGQSLTTPAQVEIDNQQGAAVISGAVIQSGQSYRIALKQTAANAVGQYSPDAVITAIFLAAPVNFAVQLTLPDQQLTATWVDHQTDATGYAIEVLDATDQPLAPPLGAQVASGGSPAQLAATQLATGTLYHVRARLLGAAALGEWCQPVPLRPVALTKPANLGVTNQPDKVTVQCDPIPNANAYQAEILNVDGRTLSPPLIARSATTSIVFDAQRLSLNSQYQIRIQALSIYPGDPVMPDAVAAPTSQILGPFSDAMTFTRSVLIAPTALTIIYDLALNQLTASWTDSEPNVKFELGIWAGPATGDSVILKTAIASSPYTLPDADRTSLAAGQSYTFQVRAEQDGSLSPWSQAVELPIITLAQPANLHVINLPTQIGVSCDAVTVTGATLWGYEAEVLDGATGSPLPTPLKAQSTTLPVYLEASGLTAGTTYKIHLRAIATATPAQPESSPQPKRARRTSRR